jgi:hypothetical protein
MLAYQTPPATAAKQATSEIPIVMSSVGDPVGTGVVRQPPATGRQYHRDDGRVRRSGWKERRA